MTRCMNILLTVVLVSMLAMATNTSMADGTGVVVICGPDISDQAHETINLDDLKEGQLVSIPGYADFRIEKIEFADWVEHTYDLGDIEYGYSSGESADFLRIRLWVLNTKTEPHDYYRDFGEILCDFADQYQFGGWLRQVGMKSKKPYDSENKHYEIDPLYEGMYDVFVTLPNYVVGSKDPLSVTFSFGGSEITCHIRK